MLVENPCRESASRIPCDNRLVEGVRGGYGVYGIRNVVAKVEANFMDELKDIVANSAKTAGIGSPEFYWYQKTGNNKRLYQMHVEFKDFDPWGRFSVSIEKDEKLTGS